MDTAQRTSRDSGIGPGIGVIIVGILFLMNNFDIIDLGGRWWALFFIIPIAFLATDVLRYRTETGLSSRARGPLIGLLWLVSLMIIFLFGINWGVIWPVTIILAGLMVLLSGWKN